MALDTLPIEARVGTEVTFKETPLITSLQEGQIKTYQKGKFRQRQVTAFSYSVFVYNLAEVETFLLAKKGYIPFIVPQTGLSYVCTEYNVAYKDVYTQGTVSLTLVPYTN